MERKEAIKVVRNIYQTDKEKEALETLIPELAESEDERIRKELISLIEKSRHHPADKARWLTYLEKQKEQHLELKAGKWYICHRAFCARADHLTVKEGERFQCEKDGIVKGFVIKEPEKYFKECSTPEPMEKEQKSDWSEEDEEIRKALIWHLKADVDFVSNGVTKAECIAYLDKQKAQRQEWSDEDKRILKGIIGLVDHNQHYNVSNKEMLAWLKSLRPVSKESLQPHWKPSEEQMEALRVTIDFMPDTFKPRCTLITLQNGLEKLMSL